MDTESLLRSLNARSVRYVVIGAGAGRPKDIEDLKALKKLGDERAR